MPEQHRKCHGLSRPQAELEYLRLAQRLAEYGLEHFDLALARRGRPPYRVGVCSRGVSVAQAPASPSRTDSASSSAAVAAPPAPTAPVTAGRHGWRDVTDISHRGRQLVIHAQHAGRPVTYSLRSQSKAKTAYAYRRCRAYYHFHGQMERLAKDNQHAAYIASAATARVTPAQHTTAAAGTTPGRHNPAAPARRTGMAEAEAGAGAGAGGTHPQQRLATPRGLAMQHAAAAQANADAAAARSMNRGGGTGTGSGAAAASNRANSLARGGVVPAAARSEASGAASRPASSAPSSLPRQSPRPDVVELDVGGMDSAAVPHPHPLLSRLAQHKAQVMSPTAASTPKSTTATASVISTPHVATVDLDDMDYGFGFGDTEAADAADAADTDPQQQQQQHQHGQQSTRHDATTPAAESSAHRPRAQAVDKHERTQVPGSRPLAPLAGLVPASDASPLVPSDNASVVSSPDASSVSGSAPEGRTRAVTLVKRPGQSLGLRLAGSGKIIMIHPGSVAHEDGRLRVKDRIVKINDRAVLGLTHDEIVGQLRDSPDTLVLTVMTSGRHKRKPASAATRADSSTAPLVAAAAATTSDDEQLPPPQKPARNRHQSAPRDTGDAPAASPALVLGPARTLVVAKSSRVGLGFTITGGTRGQVTVERVYADSPAQRVGLLPGDVLLVADDRDLGAVAVARARILLSETGATVRLVVATPRTDGGAGAGGAVGAANATLTAATAATASPRSEADSKQGTITAPEDAVPETPGPRVCVPLWPALAAAATEGPVVDLVLPRGDARRKLGAVLAGGTDHQLGGVFVTYVRQETMAAEADLRRGDRVLAVAGQNMEVGRDARCKWDASHTVLMFE